MEFMKQKWSSGFVVGLLFTALVIGGCAKGDDGSISTSVDSPSAATFRPVGTIQGKILDSTTREPIVNAVVSIGLAVDVSDAQGQYILANVPATSDALNGTVTGSYDITVDLRAVVSPVDMRVAATAPRYPDFRYQNASVSFTSLNDTDCDNINNSDSDGLDTCENSSNHDTAVDGLVSSQDVLVGKLAANIQGVVAGCSISDGDFFTPVANATVSLVSPSTLVSGSNSSTGSGRVVATATTDASGSFTFSNIEANQSFTIQAVDSATAPTAEDSVSITSPADNQTLFLRVQESTALHLCSVDTHGPEIIAVSPEPGSDLTPATTQTVVFTFSEPVAQTDETSTDPSNQVGLISSGALQVEFDGNKAPALFTAVWNATFDQLTVTMTNGTGTSALYEVLLTVAGMEDAAGNGAGIGVCPNDAPGPWVGIGGGGGDCVVYFSTNGGPAPGTTTALSLVNASSLDYASTVGIFDWPVISGAKEYNLYCQRSQVYTDGTSQVDSNYVLVSTPPLNNSSTTYNFVNFPGAGSFVGQGNEHALKYDCKVRGVNSDGTEGIDSNIVTAQDKVEPDFVLTTAAAGSPVVVITFNEPVRESDAETGTNYVLTGTDAALTLTSAVACSGVAVPVSQCTSGSDVVLTYSANLAAAAGGDTLTVTGVKDITGNSNDTTPGGNNQVTLP